MLPNAKLWFKKIPLKEISNVTGVAYHREFSHSYLARLHITALLDPAMKRVGTSVSLHLVGGQVPT